MTEEFYCPECDMTVEVAITFCPECGSELERVTTHRRRVKIAPRPLELDRLVSTLIAEHGQIRRQIDDIGATLKAGKLVRAGDLLDGLDRSLRQHIVDEEAQVLKRLISARGRDGADSDIKTMQQHRRIHRQIQAVQERLPSWSDPDVSVYVELDRLVRDHLKKEEQEVFPRALGKR